MSFTDPPLFSLDIDMVRKERPKRVSFSMGKYIQLMAGVGAKNVQDC